YMVHASKIRRAGIPILTSHTIVRADGTEAVESAVIARVDPFWNLIPGSEKTVACDVICIAVGLSPLAELLWQAGCEMRYVNELGGHVPVRNRYLETSVPGIYVAGDLTGIEEASSALVEGQLAGLEAAATLGYQSEDYESKRQDLVEQLRQLRAGPEGDKIRESIALTLHGFSPKEVDHAV
ncbi:MAG: FAD-dependent oxidoreductase, partial [Clostridiaceae bacterium]|nr:FAD-dependent oxidoreductase [Clostridiaceae bacterium]